MMLQQRGQLQDAWAPTGSLCQGEWFHTKVMN